MQRFFRVHVHAKTRFPLMHILPEAIAARTSQRECRLRLSAREQNVLVTISKTLTNQEIGRGLRISRFTARNHINRLLGIGTNTGRGRAPFSPREAAYPLYPEVAMVSCITSQALHQDLKLNLATRATMQVCLLPPFDPSNH